MVRVKTLLKVSSKNRDTCRLKLEGLWNNEDNVKRGRGCHRYKAGMTDCTCQLCVVWHGCEGCQFGMLNPSTQLLIKECTCPHDS